MKKKLNFLLVSIFVMVLAFTPVLLVAEISPWDPDDPGSGGNPGLVQCLSRCLTEYHTNIDRCDYLKYFPWAKVVCLDRSNAEFDRCYLECHKYG